MYELKRKVDRIFGSTDNSMLDVEILEIYENAPCGYISIMPNGMIAKANSTFCQLVGYSKDCVESSLKIQDLLSPNSKVYFETRLFPLASLNSKVKDVSLELQSNVRNSVPVLVSTTHVKDKLGLLKFIRMTFFDVSDRKKNEQEMLSATKRAVSCNNNLKFTAEFGLKLSEAPNFADALKITSDMVCSNISEGCLIDLLYDNQFHRVETAHVIRGTAHAMKRLSLGKILLNVSERNTRLVVNRLEQNKITSQFQKEIQSLTDHAVKSFAVFPLVADGLVIGTITFLNTEHHKNFGVDDFYFIDCLTNHISLTLQKLKLNEASSEDSKMRYHLNNLASFEIKMPLTSLKLQIESSLRQLAKSEVKLIKKAEVEKVLLKLNSSLEAICLGVDKMVELNEINQNLVIEVERVNVSFEIKQYLESIVEQVADSGCSILSDIQNDVILQGDRMRILKIFHLLIKNALIFGRHFPVQVCLSKVDGEAMLTIRDMGPTVICDPRTSSYSRKIEKMTSFEGDSLKYELNLIKTIVHAHVGKFRVSSTANENTFKVFLPLADQ